MEEIEVDGIRQVRRMTPGTTRPMFQVLDDIEPARQRAVIETSVPMTEEDLDFYVRTGFIRFKWQSANLRSDRRPGVRVPSDRGRDS